MSASAAVGRYGKHLLVVLVEISSNEFIPCVYILFLYINHHLLVIELLAKFYLQYLYLQYMHF